MSELGMAMPQADDDRQKAKLKRSAWLLGLLAVAIYVGYYVLAYLVKGNA